MNENYKIDLDNYNEDLMSEFYCEPNEQQLQRKCFFKELQINPIENNIYFVDAPQFDVYPFEGKRQFVCCPEKFKSIEKCRVEFLRKDTFKFVNSIFYGFVWRWDSSLVDMLDILKSLVVDHHYIIVRYASIEKERFLKTNK